MSISSVCRSWHNLVMGTGLFHRYLFIRNLQGLEAVVTALEESRFKAQRATRSNQHAVDIGHYVTHIRLLATPHSTIEDMDDDGPSLPLFDGRMADWDRRHLDRGLSGSYISYLRRLLACCPNLQVILDASTQNPAEECPPFLAALSSSRNQKDVSSTSTFMGGAGGLKALEYTQGSPFLGDLGSNPCVANSLVRLRALTLHFPSVMITRRDLALQLPSLTSLDLHISSSHYLHWEEAAQALIMPSLTHLTVRASHAAAPFLGARARRSLERFLAVYGAGLAFLEFIIDSAPVAAAVARPARPRDAPRGDEDKYNVPALLQFCSSLRELVIDTALVPPRTNPLTTEAENAQQASATSNVWQHRSLRRIGLRGVEINALLTNIAFSKQSTSIPASTSDREVMCQFCSAYKRDAPSLGEHVIYQSIRALLDSSPALLTLPAPAPANSSPLIDAQASAMQQKHNDWSSLKEIHLLPPRPNTPRAPGEIGPRTCCLRGAPTPSAISAWRDMCWLGGVELWVGSQGQGQR